MKKLREIKIIKRGNRESVQTTEAVKSSPAQPVQNQIAGRIKDWVREFKERKQAEELFARRMLCGNA